MPHPARPRRPTLSHATARPWDLPVGSEHGEAFTDLRGRRGWDVDELNERLEFRGAARLRNVQAPDQAYGILVQLDRLVMDTQQALARAWSLLATTHTLSPAPATEELWAQLLDARSRDTPEQLMSQVLGWSQDPQVLRQWSRELIEQHVPAALIHTAEPAPGLRRWLELVATYHMPVAAVTSLSRTTALATLAHLHLHDHFQAVVSAADGHENQAQTLLAAALRLDRPPNHCVVFDSCALGITAAHNASMKVVAVAGRSRPAWQLRTADVTVASLDQLSVINVRRLFATRGTDHGDLLKQLDPSHLVTLRDQSSSRQNKQWRQRSAITTDAS